MLSVGFSVFIGFLAFHGFSRFLWDTNTYKQGERGQFVRAGCTGGAWRHPHEESSLRIQGAGFRSVYSGFKIESQEFLHRDSGESNGMEYGK